MEYIKLQTSEKSKSLIPNLINTTKDIDLEQVPHLSVAFRNTSELDDNEDFMKMVVAGIKMKRNIDEDAIMLRNLSHQDFIDMNGHPIHTSKWTQCYPTTQATESPDEHHRMYNGVRDLEYKCLIITGFEYNPERSITEEITFMNPHVYTHAIYQMDPNFSNGERQVKVRFAAPLIWGLSKDEDQLAVMSKLDGLVTRHSGEVPNVDHIKLTGFVAMPLGINKYSNKDNNEKGMNCGGGEHDHDSHPEHKTH